MRVDAPCLSFDILEDTLGHQRKRVRELDVLHFFLPILSWIFTRTLLELTKSIGISCPTPPTLLPALKLLKASEIRSP